MPGPISGFEQPFWDTIPYHLISSESSFGIPMRAFGNLVIGFILFGSVLQRTGGGAFFNDLALALVGRYRDGAAKVAIIASGFMGSMSGSVISNVLTTGAVSIPAMRRTGFSARYAAATEACASTGGVLMPPIMGATAFVMAFLLFRPYFEIAVAAAIPSLLYYFGLFFQIDAYSARTGLKGMSGPDLPSLGKTFRAGWSYLFVFALLILLMGAFGIEMLAGTSPIQVGLEAMRLGGMIYLAPFFFVLNPALIGEGAPGDVLFAVVAALLAVLFISAALQRHLPLLGPLPEGALGWLLRLPLILGGLVLGVPNLGFFGLASILFI